MARRPRLSPAQVPRCGESGRRGVRGKDDDHPLPRHDLGGVPVISVVCWKWGKKYSVSHVAKLQSMLARHLTIPHRLVCLSDKPDELPEGVIPAKLPKPLPFDGK